ncbi:MAG TPA: NUDIX hydrolase [Blastocatellia bacterium]|nr:NUDIX hydrolase [Blastocatellia bacterium]
MGEGNKEHPKKRIAVGAMLFNERGELLIVKPTYKDHWSLPGGVVDEHESPAAALAREIEEEIGLRVSRFEFVCVDYIKDGDDESLQFKFDGGLLSDEEIARIKLQADELSEYKFVDSQSALEFLSPNQAKNTPICLEALKKRVPVYLEGGKEV